MQRLRSHWPSALLCFLGLLAASRERALPGAPGPDWQLCKHFSSQVNKLAWDLEGHMSSMNLVEEKPSEDLTPQIRCSDNCDPNKLGSDQSCLRRIREALQHYRALLGSDVFAEVGGPDPSPVATLQGALAQLTSLVQDGSFAEGSAAPPQQSQPWERPLLRRRILHQLRSFSAVMARVFAHSAATR
ncbi:interleukin-23 subunit alpha [Mauremys mutica]|uniref:interleukin-23 subunit alpha n=1 Tax=Mauremys mutica TaxID=74926 RepID=UPI001D161F49|nr:interleukin-23 subunit alpha [Mauremys mutica]